MFGLLIGFAVVVLFSRMASMDDESPLLWGLLGATAYFLPALTLGTLWGLGGTLVLGVAFCVRVMTREPPGRGRVR